VYLTVVYRECCCILSVAETGVVSTVFLQSVTTVNACLTSCLLPLNSLLLKDETKSEENNSVQPPILGTTAFTRCIVAFKENREFRSISVSLEVQVALNSIYPRSSYVRKGEQNQI
jgi:hypothetical protein